MSPEFPLQSKPAKERGLAMRIVERAVSFPCNKRGTDHRLLACITARLAIIVVAVSFIGCVGPIQPSDPKGRVDLRSSVRAADALMRLERPEEVSELLLSDSDILDAGLANLSKLSHLEAMHLHAPELAIWDSPISPN